MSGSLGLVNIVMYQKHAIIIKLNSLINICRYIRGVKKRLKIGGVWLNKKKHGVKEGCMGPSLFIDKRSCVHPSSCYSPLYLILLLLLVMFWTSLCACRLRVFLCAVDYITLTDEIVVLNCSCGRSYVANFYYEKMQLTWLK